MAPFVHLKPAIPFKGLPYSLTYDLPTSKVQLHFN